MATTQAAKSGRLPAKSARTGGRGAGAPARNPAPLKKPAAPKAGAQKTTTPPLEYSPFWILKTEPETYSFEQLEKDRRTNWNDVRNFQARNYLKRMRLGDVALIYHSGDVKAVVGIAKVIKTSYPDIDAEDPGTEWVQVDLEYIEKLPAPVPLARLKATEELSDILLIRQSRLSVSPVLEPHFRRIRELGGLKP